jgi:hypothetical protein
MRAELSSACTIDEVDSVLLGVIGELEFYAHARHAIGDSELELLREILLELRRCGGALVDRLQDCSWDIDLWVPPEAGEHVPALRDAPGPVLPYPWKPHGGRWSSPCRPTGTSPWVRYLAARGETPSTRPVKLHLEWEGLELRTSTDVELFWDRFGAGEYIRWTRVAAETCAVRFSWLVVLQGAISELLEENDVATFRGLSVCSTLWLRLSDGPAWAEST